MPRTAAKRVRPRAVEAKTSTRKSDIAEAKLLEVRNLMLEAEALNLRIEEAKAELEKDMLSGRIDKLSLEDIIAEVKASAGRAVTRIDPFAFWEATSTDDDFFSCVTISVTKAREVLSGKELAAISEVTPAKAGPKKLVVKMVKPTKGDK